MQKVERKRGRKNSRLLWVLLCFALLAGCVAAALVMQNRAGEEPPAAEKRRAGAITQRKREELDTLTVTLRGGETWTAKRQEDDTLLILDGGESWQADELLGSQLLDAAVNLTYEDILTEDPGEWEPEKQAFGLDDPLVTAEIRFTDGTGVTACIGGSADPDNDALRYMTVKGDGRLYAVSAGTAEELSVERQLLRAVPRLAVRGVLLDRIAVSDGNGETLTAWELQGRVTDRDAAENWKITAPFTYPADYDAIRNLKDSAENLRLGTFVRKAEEADGDAYGFVAGKTLTLHMAQGSTGTVSGSGVYDVNDWDERTVTLAVGNAKTDMVDYVLYDGNIYTMSHFSLDVFTGADAADTAARYPAATPLNSLESLLLERDGQESVRYAAVRLEEGTAAGEAGETAEDTARCLRNGEEIPWETFAAAYERLLTVTVSGRLPDGYTPGKVHTKYTFRTVSGGTHTVELSDYDGVHDAVTMDGDTRFYLIRGGMTELP